MKQVIKETAKRLCELADSYIEDDFYDINAVDPDEAWEIYDGKRKMRLGAMIQGAVNMAKAMGMDDDDCKDLWIAVCDEEYARERELFNKCQRWLVD